MLPAFESYEQRIDAIRAAHPEMPRSAVVRVRLLHHVMRLLNEDLERFFTGRGLSASAWAALMMIFSTPRARMSPSALSTELVQSRTHMTRIADELVGKGYVRREPDARDRRRIDLVLTGRGRHFIKRTAPGAWTHYERLLATFDSTEASALETLMRKLMAHLSADEPGKTRAGPGR